MTWSSASFGHWWCPSLMFRQWSLLWFSQFIRCMTSIHHLVTMTNGKSLVKTNQKIIHSLIAFLVWIVFFHSTSCNAFVFGIQASWRSPKTPSKTILLPNNGPAHFKQLPVLNNGPAIITSSFLQLPNDSPANQHPVPNDNSALTILQICIPTTTASTGI